MRGGYYQETDETDLRVYNSVTNLVKVNVKDIFDKVNGDAVYIENKENNIIIKYIDLYKYIIIDNNKYQYAYVMTDEFKEAIKHLNPDLSIPVVIEECFGISMNISYITKIMLGGSINKSSGGKKAVVKYTVKDLQAIAIENKIKITKKVEGKTVRLNKQGMIAKLKRYKLI